MRGDDEQQDGMFSYISPDKRVPQDHPLRGMRVVVDRVLEQLSAQFNRLYARAGRPSIAPEKLLRALLLQLLYSVRSERMLMEQLDYNLSVPVVCGTEHGRCGVGCEHVFEEPGAHVGGRHRGSVFSRGVGRSTGGAVAQ